MLLTENLIFTVEFKNATEIFKLNIALLIKTDSNNSRHS